ncbi:MAG: hypothetical protein N4A49_09090 [Marinifilaceae bacterium]|jgi:hypothetical protein|nr:hypothetical protein [Marinifilaceae bacterium]
MKVKFNESIIKAFEEGSPEEVLSAVEEFKISGNIDSLECVFNAIAREDLEQPIINKIVELMSDIKDDKIVDIYIDKLQSEQKNKKAILSACWQSGKDYSQHIDMFIDMIINSPFEESFEAFSVIENSNFHLSDEQKSRYVGLLKGAFDNGHPNNTIIHTAHHMILELS